MKQKLTKLTPTDLRKGDVIQPMGWKVEEVFSDGSAKTMLAAWIPVPMSRTELATILSLEGVTVEREGPTTFEGVVESFCWIPDERVRGITVQIRPKNGELVSPKVGERVLVTVLEEGQ